MGLEEGEREGTGPPAGPVGLGHELGLHPEGTGELWKGSEGGVTTFLPCLIFSPLYSSCPSLPQLQV